MTAFYENALNRASSFWQEGSMSHKVMLLGLIASVTVVFFLLLFWMNIPDYKVLYSRLYQEDASRVVEALKKDKILYRLEDNGATILVPADKVYDLRLKIAGEGHLRGQGIGFEIFDQNKIGQTEFVQHINYQRALQGELARTIADIPEVESARVHLVLPSKSLFIEEQSRPSAAVMLKLKPGSQLSPKQVQSMVNLVTMAVEGLEEKNISVADTGGRLLFEPRGEDNIKGLTTSQLEYKAAVEKKFQGSIEQMLLPIVGPGKVIAKVNADLDYSQKTIRKELFDPDSAVVRSEQKSEEESKGNTQLEAGVPEPDFRGKQGSGQASNQQSSRSSKTTNFEINKEEQNIVVPVGQMDRLSIAVIVDGTYNTDAAGKTVFVPRAAAEMKQIEDLVKNAVGFRSERGDTIKVTNFAFGEAKEFVEEKKSLVNTLSDYAKMLLNPMLLKALIVLIFILVIAKPVVMALTRPRVSGESLSELEGLPEGERRAALQAGVGLEDSTSKQARMKLETLKLQAVGLVQKNQEQAVAVTKRWVKEGA